MLASFLPSSPALFPAARNSRPGSSQPSSETQPQLSPLSLVYRLQALQVLQALLVHLGVEQIRAKGQSSQNRADQANSDCEKFVCQSRILTELSNLPAFARLFRLKSPPPSNPPAFASRRRCHWITLRPKTTKRDCLCPNGIFSSLPT